MTDSPFIPSGMGRLGREIAVGLSMRGHEIGYLGWFHRTDIFPNLPNNIQFWWTNNNYFGADILDRVVNQFQPDMLISISDVWHVQYITDGNQCRTRRFFQWCHYIPVDGEPISGGVPPANIPIIEDFDIPVAYTNYAKNAVLKSVMDEEVRRRLTTIYHGVDVNNFKPGDQKKRREVRNKYGIDDKFIFLTVSRNQSRKNIPQLFQAWKQFSEIPEVRDKVILWPHMYFKDPAGWDIDDLLRVNGLNNHSIMYFEQVAHGPSEMHLMPDANLAELYQIADAFVLLAGEGFGLPTFEAMATKLPCVLLDHSASAEIGGEGRAHLVPVSGTVTWTGLHLTERPIPDKAATVEAFLKIFKDKKYRDEIASKGYDFARQYTWTRVLDDWENLIQSYEMPFLHPMQMEVVV